MTRKEALLLALHHLYQLGKSDEITNATLKIKEIVDDMPFTSWSEATIFDTLDQFVSDHGRMPATTDLRAKGLPDPPVIASRFGMTAKDFLDRYYPKSSHLSKYCHRNKEEWKQYFIDTLLSMENQTSGSYNDNRCKDTPVWQTIACMHGFAKWSDWVEYCGIVPNQKKRPPNSLEYPRVFVVRADTKLFGKIATEHIIQGGTHHIINQESKALLDAHLLT